MSDTKFTKGEWFPCFGSYEVAVLKDGRIETLITDTGPQSIPDDNEAQANQHLIAAAPDMYELLVTIENDVDQVPDWLWGKIQGTLKKARGE